MLVSFVSFGISSANPLFATSDRESCPGYLGGSHRLASPSSEQQLDSRVHDGVKLHDLDKLDYLYRRILNNDLTISNIPKSNMFFFLEVSIYSGIYSNIKHTIIPK